MKKLIVILFMLMASTAWGVTIILDQPYYQQKPAVAIKMDRMTVGPGFINVPLNLIDEDGKRVGVKNFRIINNPPIYAYNSSDEITSTLYPGDTDFNDLIQTPLDASNAGMNVFMPLRGLVKAYILNKLGIAGN